MSRRSKFLINSNGQWISASEQLANEAINYFIDLFSSPQAITHFPSTMCKRILTNNARTNIYKPFELEEIKSAVF